MSSDMNRKGKLSLKEETLIRIKSETMEPFNSNNSVIRNPLKVEHSEKDQYELVS